MSEHGDLIRATRIQKGINQRELAFRTGFSHAYIVKIEKGQQRGSYLVLMKLAKALGIPEGIVLEKAGFTLISESKRPDYDPEFNRFNELDPKVKRLLLDIAPIVVKYMKDK